MATRQIDGALRRLQAGLHLTPESLVVGHAAQQLQVLAMSLAQSVLQQPLQLLNFLRSQPCADRMAHGKRDLFGGQGVVGVACQGLKSRRDLAAVDRQRFALQSDDL